MLDAAALKQARLKAGLSQGEAAEKLGVSRQAMSRWENGHGYPEPDNLVEIGKLYAIPLELLFGSKLQELPVEKPADNSMFLLVLSAIAAIVPFLGFGLSYVIYKKNKATNEWYKVINLVVLVVLVFNIFSAWNVISTMMPGETHVVKLDQSDVSSR